MNERYILCSYGMINGFNENSITMSPGDFMIEFKLNFILFGLIWSTKDT